jgi:hypothetical protein
MRFRSEAYARLDALLAADELDVGFLHDVAYHLYEMRWLEKCLDKLHLQRALQTGSGDTASLAAIQHHIWATLHALLTATGAISHHGYRALRVLLRTAACAGRYELTSASAATMPSRL